MPPPKSRNPDQDSRSDASVTKDKHTASNHSHHARGRRNGGPTLTNGSHLKEVVSASGDAHGSVGRNGAHYGQMASTGGLAWNKEDLTLLQGYRNAYRLDCPSAFKNPMAHAILGRGIGKYSPTMTRKRNERRVSKDQLAMAVRKNFNALAVSESEVIVDLMYKVKTQDKTFRMRFAPPRTR
ncbi:uncharacterized protein K452DRAFT_272289 [Aplosporella prunicola CBS 121167]|uniref:Histone deacetylase complex subunit SAP30 Sin3 binding domain-containing protein n=1 Tax=Aplosporella prunicola CBS 121167 TaxID=1176127 RepID=A0A6A6BFZ0_9PEZI|nr:uncharacterized protein K452DRAFT_272289 [Aplosporella prunicola CBS 121167]KAF2141421.1 hypothetical protein K452DRAFT_272289 [Aplosporella prunicola CBS 121167]